LSSKRNRDLPETVTQRDAQRLPKAHRAYVAPKLIVFGPVAALTAGGTGSNQEGMKMVALKRHP